jgi:hypothetical protein
MLWRMWMDMEAVELDPVEIAEARRRLAPLCAGGAFSVSSIERDDEVVVSVELGVGLTGVAARVELQGGVLVVHVPRAKG